MPKKVALNLGGQTIEGEVMEFKTLEEGWSRYQLEDGTIVRVKIVATDLIKLPTRDQVTGLPQVMLRATNVMSVEPPETYRKYEVH